MNKYYVTVSRTIEYGEREKDLGKDEGLSLEWQADDPVDAIAAAVGNCRANGEVEWFSDSSAVIYTFDADGNRHNTFFDACEMNQEGDRND